VSLNQASAIKLSNILH